MPSPQLTNYYLKKSTVMKKNVSQGLLVIAGGILFSLVFWQEKLGLNALLFDVFILAAIFFTYANARQSAVVRWLLIGHLICLAMLIINNTMVSKIAFIATLLLFTGFAEYTHRSAWYAGGSVLLNVIYCIASIIDQFKGTGLRKSKRVRLSKFIRFAIFPVLLVAVFFIIYLFSNSVFQEMASRFELIISKAFGQFFDVFSPQRLLFLVLGIYITGSILLRSKLNYFASKEQGCKDDLERRKISWKERVKRPFFQFIEAIMGRFSNGTMALRNENTVGMISIVLLNILLLAVNCIDISYLWFNFDYMGEVFLYKMLHEGTELLIISIVLAMLVVLFFFKGNLNFYRRNKWLKYGSYAWILQNCILVVSVLLRDYYYIARYGLAYKRIGVLFFLSMVLIGLATVLIKIRKRKTTYYLLRVNAWAAVTILVLATTIHWDEFITAYNIQRKDRVPLDTTFLLSLSDKTLPLLDKNQALFNPEQREQIIHQREERFMHEQGTLSWLSWNYADSYTKKYLKQKGF
jgi:hypothetical protein